MSLPAANLRLQKPQAIKKWAVSMLSPECLRWAADLGRATARPVAVGSDGLSKWWESWENSDVLVVRLIRGALCRFPSNIFHRRRRWEGRGGGEGRSSWGEDGVECSGVYIEGRKKEKMNLDRSIVGVLWQQDPRHGILFLSRNLNYCNKFCLFVWIMWHLLRKLK